MKKISLLLLASFIWETSFANEKTDSQILNQYFKEKNYTKGIAATKKYIADYPKSKDILQLENRIAKAYFITKKYNEAIVAFQNILKKYELKPEQKNEIYYYIAKSYTSLNNSDNANVYIAKIQKESLYYERAFYDKGVIFLDIGDYKNAFDTFKMIAVAGRTLSKSATFNMAVTAYNDEHYEMTTQVLDSYVQLQDPNRDEATILYMYGSSYYKLDKTEKAISYFEKLADKYPKTPYGRKAKVTLIEIYVNKDDVANVNKYSQMVKDQPEEGEALSTLGDYYVSKKDFNKAISYYSQADLTQNTRSLYGYAYSLYNLDRPQEALELFKKLENTNYHNQTVYYEFASYYKLKQYQKIIDNRSIAKKIVVTQQDNDNINLIIANAAYEIKDYKLSQQYFASLNLHRPSIDNIFRAITLSGKVNKALDVSKLMTSYKELYPGDKTYKKRIYVAAGEALYNNGQSDLAKLYYEDYLQSDPKDEDILQALSAVLVNSKNYSELAKYLDMQKETPDTIYLKGVAATGLGNYEQGEAFYSKVLTLVDTANPLYNKVMLNRTNNFFLWEHYDDAIANGIKYLAIVGAPEKKDVLQKVGISYFRTGKIDASRAAYAQLETVFGDKDLANMQIADTYLSEKNYTKANELYANLYNTSTDRNNKEIALFSLIKIASLTNSPNFNSLNEQFLNEFPDSQYKENILSTFLKVAESKGNNKEALGSYLTIYTTTLDETTKQDAAEKIANIYLETKSYDKAYDYANVLTDELKRTLLLAQIFTGRGKKAEAANMFEDLMKYPEYQEYASLNLGKYWFSVKNYAKARTYFTGITKIPNSQSGDYAYFQLGAIDELEKKSAQAVSDYYKVYSKYPKSQYADDARVKAATIEEKRNPTNAIKIYESLAAYTKQTSYKSFALEKLVYYNLKNKDIPKAKKYYETLKTVDKETATKYADFFKASN